METWREKQERVLCENESSLSRNIINPSCIGGKKEYKVEVKYNDVESDIFYLCGDCKNAIKKDCEKWGYEMNYKELKN